MAPTFFGTYLFCVYFLLLPAVNFSQIAIFERLRSIDEVGGRDEDVGLEGHSDDRPATKDFALWELSANNISHI
jgi:hypothetical protein